MPTALKNLLKAHPLIGFAGHFLPIANLKNLVANGFFAPQTGF
jgi:hypothetical protein